MHIREKCPEIVHSFELFDGDKPFGPIKLMGAISSITSYNAEKHDTLSTVIRYFTPYHDSSGKDLLLCIALGDSMSVNTILGMTIITEWRLALEFEPKIICSIILRESFDLVYEHTKRMVIKPASPVSNPTDISREQIAVMHNLSSNNDVTAPVAGCRWHSMGVTATLQLSMLFIFLRKFIDQKC